MPEQLNLSWRPRKIPHDIPAPTPQARIMRGTIRNEGQEEIFRVTAVSTRQGEFLIARQYKKKHKIPEYIHIKVEVEDLGPAKQEPRRS